VILFGTFFFLLLILLIPLLAVFLFFRLVTISFTKLGIPSWAVIFIFSLSLLGSLINIPVWYDTPSSPPTFYFHPPVFTGRIIAINLGGCIIPSILALYLLRRANIPKTLFSTGVVALVCYFIANPIPGVGIMIPFFIPPLVSAGIAMLLTRGRNAAPVAYISGVMGTLLGADLLHIGDLPAVGILSIGGAGVFDGIFLTGILAAFLT